MLKLANVHIKRGSLVIADQLDLSLEKGKVYTVLGPNGAGKSSLLKTIFGEIGCKGQIHYADQILNKRAISAWRKRIGYMPQDTQVDASLTALEVILLGRMEALNMHVSDELLTEVATIMQKLGIAHLAHQDVMQLSGGQRQMVMFAQVLLRQPEILLLDEPVSALDMHHQINLLEHVCQYTQQNNLITIMVLHDLSLAAQFSDQVILLGNGKLQAFGDAKQVLQADLIRQLYNVEIEILYDSTGQPVIRPLRHSH
ncbi:ABC transporter ATP-binding protein [Actinobacillus equuli]|uniref:ABC transporter ATP-binding protein n=1 Tax=Actinobacillus equuli TaxID=718 RepID=UPI0024423B14|nr:ABC transporter ATP-binding protein [Actinobacillus equuli]WGE48235.1 ABC transporter ATP-binding protein [Actinobacillus equuli subsp. equuli]WGE58721.1 ABC transporter ATP-binding protein [Actinobacillus equuli subsp. haemolyticus]WGE60687.1 ABC transporter ATP-binding protein [Actinobacillus equuli subsp. haemolyticus]WGE80912.1 ABC transporter ATP-binding protein [Actinobacillus equuli subsp. haemolyticus]